jgi:hypothetical protein
MGDSTKLRSKELVRLARTELAREQADVLAFVNKNRGGCDTLSYDLADFIDAVAVSTRASHAFARLAVLETGWQLDDLAIPVDEGKQVSLLFACELVAISACYARNRFRNPITGSGCCARPATGHAAAAPPSSVMNSRRFN